MNLKKFSIASGIFTALIIVLSIVLSCIKTTTSFIIEKPSAISIYNHSTVSTTYSETNTKSKYYELYEKLKNIGTISILERAINKIEVNDTLSQDVNRYLPNWAGDSNLKNNICIEIKYETTQSQIVYVDGDSKKIDYKQLIFILPEDGKTQQIAIYFMISSGSTYSASPILMNVNCKDLYNYIKTL